MMRGAAVARTGAVLCAAALLAAPAWPAVADGAARAAAGAQRGATVRDANVLAIDEMLRSARLWQMLDVAQNERAELLKILAVDADEARALLLLGQLALRGGDIEQARLLQQRLRRRHGGGAADIELQQLMRVHGRDKERLAQLRLALRGGNTARALALARTLFPDGRPPGALANEFAPLLAQTRAGWETQRALFAGRVAADPNAPDQLSLYALLAQHEDTRGQALRGYAALAQTPDAPPQRVAQAWRQALQALDAGEQRVAEQRRFLQRFPNDAPMRAALAADQARIAQARAAADAASDDPAVQARAAGQRALDAGALDEAEVQLQRSLALRPGDPQTIGALGLLRLRQGRDDEALAQFEAALRRSAPDAGARWSDLAATARYWAALQAARALRDAGALEAAAQRVLEVEATQPEQTEAPQLLAELRARQGRDDEAEAGYRRVLERDPGNVRAWRGRLSLQLRAGAIDAALDQAQDLGARAGVALPQVLDATVLRDAVERAGAGHPDAAVRLLERATRLLPHDPWLRYDLAQQYRRLGLPELARQVMREGLALDPDDAQMHYASALLYAATDDADAALAALDAVAPQGRSAGMRGLAQRLRFEGALRSARQARAQGRVDDDAQARAQALIEAGEDVARRLRVARADIAAQDLASARRVLDTLRAPGQALAADQRRDLAEASIDAGDAAGALADIAAALARTPVDASASQESADWLVLRARAHARQRDAAGLRADLAQLDSVLPADDVAHRLQVLRLLDDDRASARRWTDALLAQHPHDPQVLLEAARQAELDGAYAQALDLLQTLLALPAPANAPAAAVPLLALEPLAGASPTAMPPEPSAEDLRARARAQQADIAARRQPHVDVAVLHYQRSADAGTSTLRGTELPLLAVWPQGYDGHWFAQLDAVRLDAGALPAALAAAGQLGTVQALAPPQGLARAVDETASGLSVAAGWRGEMRRYDLGLVGAGFKAPSIVGGWRESRQWGEADVSAEASRRVQTGSLLSYAGVADPVTGAVWGGVTNTALKLRAARDLPGRWSASTGLTLGLLSGRNLPSNPMLQWRGLLERDWLRGPDWRLSVGGLLNIWHYGRNESFYTFGQGGYYSPQRYVSVGLPLEIAGRRGLLSYDLRATPSRSWTYEQDTPYYPGRADLQARAGNPVHGAGAGGGLAGSLRADLEYRLSPHWAVGAWLDIDRSAYYAPTQAMLYLRYAVAPQSGPVRYAPSPLTPISQY